ncbi:ABC transporter permease [Aneurinibacillus migulanus]|uniref:ABC transporter permease n=1 Tax=Aneurinibacillus migulanus TaxID=47500 RepID=A0A0D1W9R4_ANEMI|nr:ABC transporter permease [Aneurinibacillus migulanus]KIV55345.1 ABC transporter permease [Aneurinibacillus migulanus]KON96663.1 ABC transporter permease [Aneurinibacillus migulanus]MED0896460.1 ABC transporter permease [Aneurinibacillus migulanus]MED1618212.1 ABC transporter permease [Aneurinibacillus migulanus]SDJ84945.1 hypothetical protein SAMN04487909_13022 [Aneurinibacillus migulanus]
MIFRLLLAEGMKLKRICLWLPLISAVILNVVTAVEWYLYFRQGPGGVYAGFSVMFLFLSFILLLSITLLTSIISSTEHDTGSWKQLCALPISRMYIYLSKTILVISLHFLTIVFILLGIVLLWIFYTSKPIPWGFMIKQLIYCYLASLPVLAIQQWLSTQFQNQAIPIAFGVMGAMSSLFLARTESNVVHMLPWAYAPLSTPLLDEHMQWVYMGVISGIALIIAGALRFAKSEVH